MRVKTSYSIGDRRVTRYTSAPAPTANDLTRILDYTAWVSEQDAPRVEASES